MDPSGGWATHSGPRTSRSIADHRTSRFATGVRAERPRLPPNLGYSGKRFFDGRNSEASLAQSTEEQTASKEGSLPPKPPASAHQVWATGHSNRTARERNQHNRSAGRPEGVDSYIPHYSTINRTRDKAGNSPSSIDRRALDIDHAQDLLKWDEGRNQHASRKRSRSPDLKATRNENRIAYRR